MPSSVLVSSSCGYIAKLSVHFQSHFSLLLKSFVAVTHSVAQGGLELIPLLQPHYCRDYSKLHPYSTTTLQWQLLTKTWFYVYKCFADIYVCAL